MNQHLEQMLCAYVNFQMSDWDDWLVYTEFAYNNSVSKSTGQTPFQVVMGSHVHSPAHLTS